MHRPGLAVVALILACLCSLEAGAATITVSDVFAECGSRSSIAVSLVESEPFAEIGSRVVYDPV